MLFCHDRPPFVLVKSYCLPGSARLKYYIGGIEKIVNPLKKGMSDFSDIPQISDKHVYSFLAKVSLYQTLKCLSMSSLVIENIGKSPILWAFSAITILKPTLKHSLNAV